MAQARSVSFNLPARDLGEALRAFAVTADLQIVFDESLVRGKRAPALRGAFTADEALDRLLMDSGLVARPSAGGVLMVERPGVPSASLQQTPPAQAEGGEPAGPDIIVTAQKRAERIQDVPIAISAFTQETLDKQKIEGGPDLLKAIPNVTFSKNNFAGYNFAIRGVGTKAISVATDPGVAVSFNSTTLLTNRLFEQEFYDINRVEVLRGPQGTLYGRNATGGVINIIANVANPGAFEGAVKVEAGNYDTRRASGFVNIPLAPDMLALRVAGAFTTRSGYTYNDITQNQVDGRDLWSTRSTLSMRFSPSLRADLIWEHFEEDDDRSRTGKQLCHRDDGPESIGAATNLNIQARGILSQGCKAGSLYADEAYGVPNGLSLPYVILGADPILGLLGREGSDGRGTGRLLIQPGVDPYASTTQSRDLRQISSVKDPIYRASANVYQFNANWDVADRLQLTSQTTYNTDTYYSSQDYNRFNTQPIFGDSNGLFVRVGLGGGRPAPAITPGGIYTDPQLGPSDRLVAYDLITAQTEQFSQELRLSSTGNGALQFTGGGNYTYYTNKTDYYVFANALTALLQLPNPITGNWSEDVTKCRNPRIGPDPLPIGSPGTEGCVYIDPNPLDSINGEGHNYFRSANRYSLYSFGIFGDATYAVSPRFKLIAGLRYNDDLKVTTPIPSQLLLSTRPVLGGAVDRGYPADPDIRQHFRAVTGRAGVQWTPQTSFTDETMIYATYSRGYKAGGTNPPPVGFAKVNPLDPTRPPIASPLSYPADFRSEYINAFEIGAKNTLLNGRMTLNLTGYYYDFKDYQVSQIIDRTAINENFDATTYGVELETLFRPIDAITLNANLGYQRTRIGDGQQSLDVLDRLQGNDDYVVIKPFPVLPSNCVVAKSVVEEYILRNRRGGTDNSNDILSLYTICPNNGFSSPNIPDSAFPNEGRGFFDDVSGNELPNAPRLTFNLGAEFTLPFAGDWVATVRGDYYRQSSSYARVYNTVADELRAWDNVNLSLRIGNPVKEVLFELYVKNVFNTTPITDAFINSDDSGLTTNIFVFDPRLIGLNITKKF